MRFSKFHWNNFLESTRGQVWIKLFSGLQKKYVEEDKLLRRFMESMWKASGLSQDRFRVKKEINDVLKTIDQLKQAEKKGLLPKKIKNKKEASTYFQLITGLNSSDLNDNDSEDLFYVNDIPRLSVALFLRYPEYFFPYYFHSDFYELKKIFEEFGIFFPPVPPKEDHDARFNYYFELCQSLYKFSKDFDFSHASVPVFLYGFAPLTLDLQLLKIKDLPKPSRAWFVGGGVKNNGDFEFLDKINMHSQTFWQGSKETQEGDIIVLYCLAPRSYIHSIWRAIRPGTIEPFFHYYNIIKIGYPQLVKPLKFTEMKADHILCDMPLVKGNMQGINGKQISKKFYDRIIFLLKKKGTKFINPPKLAEVEDKTIRVKTERDVEKYHLEPLLEKLGFKSTDWERQVKLRFGRSERGIPDYLLLTKHESLPIRSVHAKWVWEAKLSITSDRQLHQDFQQACSYAKQVGACGVGLISKEGVWLGLKNDNYTLKTTQHWSIQQLKKNNHLTEVKELASKSVIEKLT
jgi:hypothetical protein